MLAQAIEPGWLVLAAGFSAAGALALFESWRRRGASHRRLMTGGWLALLISVPLWIAAGGPDRGAALAALAAMSAIAIILAAQYARPDGEARRTPSRVASDLSVPVSAARIARTVYVGALCIVAGLLIAVFASGSVYAGVLAAGLPQPDALFWSVLVLPAAWGAFMVIPALDLTLRTRSLIMVGLVLLSGGAFALAALLTGGA